MDLLTVRNAIASYAEWLEHHNMKQRPMYLIWHGGEPLICGIDYYQSVFDLQKEFPDFTIRNAFQTNGTLITQEWIDFFKEKNAQVGISIDGPKHVHDIHRLRITKASSFESTMRGVRLLRKNECNYSAISVLSNETAEYILETLDFLVAEGFSVVDFIPSFLHNDPSTLGTKKYAEAMVGLYDHWKQHYEGQVYIRFLGDIEGRVRNNITSVGCELAGCCGENLSINVFGDVYPCECTSTFHELCIGNINKTSFEQMFSGSDFDSWKTLVNQIDDKCISKCTVAEICRGGCFNRRYQGEGKTERCDLFCAPRYAIMKHVQQSIQKEDNCHVK
ncbi:MAG: hypothetical protein A3H42_03310 [Deltaproteobacteria bacterium RIFCSPLOWO2_02_FULL_46_8]|nr:MAG: hypothetical protein A3H42_03310 [Deltaproteobacteria bacterium RIFCSPLOWO2_02_FULL_46_8]